MFAFFERRFIPGDSKPAERVKAASGNLSALKRRIL
jgi:hypothetical protein